jgi:hypothetical protein
MQRHGCGDVKLVEGDITMVPDTELPEQCSGVLIDVDLKEPTYVALQRFWPRVAPGGFILVDDCEFGRWKAGIGYSDFCRERGFEERYMYGMGILSRQVCAGGEDGAGGPNCSTRSESLARDHRRS